MSFLKPFLLFLCLMVGLVGTGAAQSDLESLRPLVNALAEGKYKETQKQIGDLAATGDPAVAPVLEALSAGELFFRKSDKQVFIAQKAGKGYALSDPLTLEDAGETGRRAVTKIKVNNNLRRVIRSALGSLTLLAPDPKVRMAAAEAVYK
ncbi:MAG: urea ABC transporter permease subunit UrtB, partial [Roseibium sp.]